MIPSPAEEMRARIPCADDLHRRRHERAVLALEMDEPGVLVDLPGRGLELQFFRQPALAVQQIDPANSLLIALNYSRSLKSFSGAIRTNSSR